MQYILGCLVVCFAGSASALLVESTQIIPNPYKIDREGHSAGAAAAWNPQRLAGGFYEREDSTSKIGIGPKTTTEGQTFSGYTYQHYDPVSFEVAYSMESNEDDIAPVAEAENTDFAVRLGAVVPNTSLSLGLDYNLETDDSTTSGLTTTDEMDVIQVSSSVKLQNGIFVGGGISKSEERPDAAPTVESDMYYVGAGLVQNTFSGEATAYYDDEGSETEYGFLAQGGLAVGDNQIIGAAGYISGDDDVSDISTTTFIVNAGYYFDLTQFYVQPEVAYFRLDTSDPVADSDLTLIMGQLEVGMRTPNFNVYGVVGVNQSEGTLSVLGDAELDDLLFAVGAHAYF
jgi:hypothetical protein